MASSATKSIRPRKPRYCVGVAGEAPTYRGNSRLVAWTTWVLGRRRLVAFDRRVLIIYPSYWLRGEGPPVGFVRGEY